MVGSVPLYSGSIKAKLNQLIKSAPAAVLHIVYLFVPITFIIVWLHQTALVHTTTTSTYVWERGSDR